MKHLNPVTAAKGETENTVFCLPCAAGFVYLVKIWIEDLLD